MIMSISKNEVNLYSYLIVKIPRNLSEFSLTRHIKDNCLILKMSINNKTLDFEKIRNIFDIPTPYNNFYISDDTLSSDMNKKKEYSGQRSPTLNTVLMVEATLQKTGEVISIGKLKRILPKQIMHPTLMAIIKYLEYSGKIIVHDNDVLWAYKPKSKLKKMKGTIIR